MCKIVPKVNASSPSDDIIEEDPHTLAMILQIETIIAQLEKDCAKIKIDCDQIEADHAEIRKDHAEIRKGIEEIRKGIEEEKRYDSAQNLIFQDEIKPLKCRMIIN